MRVDSIASGTTVFLDANMFVYAYAPDPNFGQVCIRLLDRLAKGDIFGIVSVDIISDVAHRMMSLEACKTFQWPYAGIASKLKHHPDQIKLLKVPERCVDAIKATNVRIVSATWRNTKEATLLSQKFGLMTKDAMIVALMKECQVTPLASHDADFDRVPGIVRFDAT